MPRSVLRGALTMAMYPVSRTPPRPVPSAGRDSHARGTPDAPQQTDAGTSTDLGHIRWERAARSSHSQEQAEDIKAHQRMIGDITQQYELNLHRATETVAEVRGQLAGLQNEVFQAQDAIRQEGVGSNGPYDEDVEDLPPRRSTQPHTFVYEDARTSAQERHPQPPLGRSSGVRGRTSALARTNHDIGDRRRDDPDGRFRWSGEGDARRLHPDRKDHAQVPWFQCVAHECRYHFKEKHDNDHWPIRERNKDGITKPIRWTFDHGQSHPDYMWYYEYLSGNRLNVRPRKAWPMSCVLAP